MQFELFPDAIATTTMSKQEIAEIAKQSTAPADYVAIDILHLLHADRPDFGGKRGHDDGTRVDRAKTTILSLRSQAELFEIELEGVHDAFSPCKSPLPNEPYTCARP